MSNHRSLKLTLGPQRPGRTLAGIAATLIATTAWAADPSTITAGTTPLTTLTPKSVDSCSVVVGATLNIAPGTGGSASEPYATATCSSGYMTGGSCQFTPGIEETYRGPALSATTHAPASNKTWACYFHNGLSTPAVLRAVAICCN